MEGVKYDQGKPSLLDMAQTIPCALKSVAKVLEFGAKKYREHNWIKVDRGLRRYHDAALRHLLAAQMGMEFDDETGLPHLAHAACCLMFAVDVERGPTQEYECGIASVVPGPLQLMPPMSLMLLTRAIPDLSSKANAAFAATAKPSPTIGDAINACWVSADDTSGIFEKNSAIMPWQQEMPASVVALAVTMLVLERTFHERLSSGGD